jgi:hypothetical protein
MLDAVYVDLRQKQIVGVAAKPAFRSLFAAREGSLKAPSPPEGADSNRVSGDLEGIRGRRKHRLPQIDPRLKRWGITVAVGGSALKPRR